MDRVGLVGLCKIEFPDADVLLCDGAFQTWGAETYKSSDAVFGAIGSIESLSEGTGDQVPALEMVLLPNKDSQPAELSQPGFQRSRARFWIAEYNVDTHALVGTPDLLFDGQVDQTIMKVGRTERSLAVSVVSLTERLFERNTGNSLNPTWHKTVWPGELGHDNATGLSISVAWGAEKPTQSGGGTNTTNPYGSGNPFSGIRRNNRQ